MQDSTSDITKAAAAAQAASHTHDQASAHIGLPVSPDEVEAMGGIEAVLAHPAEFLRIELAEMRTIDEPAIPADADSEVAKGYADAAAGRPTPPPPWTGGPRAADIQNLSTALIQAKARHEVAPTQAHLDAIGEASYALSIAAGFSEAEAAAGAERQMDRAQDAHAAPGPDDETIADAGLYRAWASETFMSILTTPGRATMDERGTLCRAIVHLARMTGQTEQQVRADLTEDAFGREAELVQEAANETIELLDAAQGRTGAEVVRHVSADVIALQHWVAYVAREDELDLLNQLIHDAARLHVEGATHILDSLIASRQS